MSVYLSVYLSIYISVCWSLSIYLSIKHIFSHVLSILAVKTSHNVEEYSFNQSTLEQVNIPVTTHVSGLYVKIITWA